MNDRKLKMQDELLLCPKRYLCSESISVQQEKSMMGQRTRFLALHRYVDCLSDVDLKVALEKVKEKFVSELKQCPKDSFTDTKILEDVIHFEVMLRDGYDVSQLEDVKESYLQNVKLAEMFDCVTSEHMIGELKK